MASDVLTSDVLTSDTMLAWLKANMKIDLELFDESYYNDSVWLKGVVKIMVGDEVVCESTSSMTINIRRQD